MKHTKKLLSLLLVLCLVLSLSCTAFAAGEAKPLDQILKMTPDTPEQPSAPTQIPTQVLKAA